MVILRDVDGLTAYIVYVTGCVVNGTTYGNGDSWRSTEEPCIICRCEVCMTSVTKLSICNVVSAPEKMSTRI